MYRPMRATHRAGLCVGAESQKRSPPEAHNLRFQRRGTAAADHGALCVHSLTAATARHPPASPVGNAAVRRASSEHLNLGAPSAASIPPVTPPTLTRFRLWASRLLPVVAALPVPPLPRGSLLRRVVLPPARRPPRHFQRTRPLSSICAFLSTKNLSFSGCCFALCRIEFQHAD